MFETHTQTLLCGDLFTQALNRLKGKAVLVSKTAVERKAEVETTN